MISEFVKGLHLPKGVWARALKIEAEAREAWKATVELQCMPETFESICRDEAHPKPPEPGPIAKRLQIDETTETITFDGVKIALHVLEGLTQSTPERTWLRIDREGDEVTVTERREPEPPPAMEFYIVPAPPLDTSHPLLADPPMGHRLGRFA